MQRGRRKKMEGIIDVGQGKVGRKSWSRKERKGIKIKIAY